MEEILTINKNRTLLPSEDYELLREEGLTHIQNLAGKVWTDYNTHDPGITLLELLSYAITDLGYRTSRDVKDLIQEEVTTPLASDSFHTALNILTTNPVSSIDIRKILIDRVPRLRNAWILKSKKTEVSYGLDYANSQLISGSTIESLNGLYKIILEPRANVIDVDSLADEVKAILHQYRGLCEDFFEIIVSEKEEVFIESSIEIEKEADPEAVLAEIYFRIGKLIAPTVKFYSFDEMKKRGNTTEDIFEGPILQNGFIDTNELSQIEPKVEIYTSDIINEIMDIEGVLEVNNIDVFSFVDSRVPKISDADANSEGWILTLRKNITNDSENYNPVFSNLLEENHTKILLYKGTSPIKEEDIDEGTVIKRFENLLLSDQKTAGVNDLEIPEGRFENIQEYSAIQDELPLSYGTGQFGLPESASPKRKGQAKQLKAYLIFFEQLLANYLSQLENSKDLLSWKTLDKTYYSQKINDAIKDGDDLLDGDLTETKLDDLAENELTFFDRRNRFLEHQIARFNEEMVEYSIMMYGILSFQEANTDLIEDRTKFLEEYPILSADRGKGFNYKNDGNVWNTDNVPGYQKRVARLLGIDDYDRRFLNVVDLTEYPELPEETEVATELSEGLHVLEHILFRPKVTADAFLKVNLGSDKPNTCSFDEDPYSFRMTVILPAFLLDENNNKIGRATEFNFRKHAEKIMRMEAPAHIAVDIIWVDPTSVEFALFENCYKAWLMENAKASPNQTILTEKLNCLLGNLNQLEDVYEAFYTVNTPRNEDTYTTKHEILATVFDPVAPIVEARIEKIENIENRVGSNPSTIRDMPLHFVGNDNTVLDNPKSGLNYSSTNPLIRFLNYKPAGYTDISGPGIDPRVNDVGTFSILDETIQNKAGKWRLDIITTNELGGQTLHKIIIEIIDDHEAVYVVEDPFNEDTYEKWDILARVSDNDDEDAQKIISAIIEGITPSNSAGSSNPTDPTYLKETIGIVISKGVSPIVRDIYDISGSDILVDTTDNLNVGDIVVLDETKLKNFPKSSGHYTFSLQIKTVDEDGGITNHSNANNKQVLIKILADIEAVYTVTPAKSVYAYTQGEILATVSDGNGNVNSAQQIGGSLPPSTTLNLNNGTIAISNRDAFIEGVNSDLGYPAEFSKYINCDYKDAAPLSSVSYTSTIKTVDNTGGITVQDVTITINRDEPAVYTFSNKAIISSDRIIIYEGEFEQGEVIATVKDPDGPSPNNPVNSAIRCGNFIDGAVLNPNNGAITVSLTRIILADTTAVLNEDTNTQTSTPNSTNQVN